MFVSHGRLCTLIFQRLEEPFPRYRHAAEIRGRV